MPDARRRIRPVLGSALMLVLSLCGRAAAEEETKEPLRVAYRFPAPVVERQKGHHRLSMDGLESWGTPGTPLLPRREARILLPPGAVVTGIAVKTSSPILLEGRFRLEPAPGEHAPIDGGVPAAARPLEAVYRSAGPFPPREWEDHGVRHKAGRAVLFISLHPVTYFPSSGEVSYREAAEVEVSYRSPAGAAPKEGAPSAALLAELSTLVDNPPPRVPPVGRAKRTGGPRAGGGAEGVAGEVAYAVITSPELSSAFEPLVAARARGGLPAAIFTTDWIHDRYEGVRPDGGTDEATRIRNFIADYHRKNGLRYVLLGGDADGALDCEECGPPIVPTRLMQTEALIADRIPSDLYFGCLDGTFDGDGDGIYGESGDGEGGGDVDLLFEVHVGRAPVDSPEEARNFVRKTLAYEALPSSVLRQVLLVGERLGFGGEYDWGDNLNEHIRFGSNAFIETVGFESSPYRDFLRVATLYDRDAVGQSWSPRTLVEALERGVHIVNHVGHADISNVMKLTAPDIDALSGTGYFLGYTQSCYAGAFDNQRTDGSHGADSVVEHFLTGPAGAVAFIANSRRGWAGSDLADGPSHRFNRRFWDVVFRGTLQWGAANDRSREENLAYITSNQRARWCAYQLNTLGDPALTLRFSSSRGSLAFDRSLYNSGESAGLTLIDSDLNLDPEEIERARVNVKAAASGDEEPLDLEETSASSGVFRGQIPLRIGNAAPGGTLELLPPDDLLALYQDADNGSGTGAPVEATARALAPLALAGPCPPEGALGVPYRGRLSAEGGQPPYLFSAESGYAEEASGAAFEGLGVRQNWNEDQGAWVYPLPFLFPFYGRLHEAVTVSADGFLELGSGNALDFTNTVEDLIANARIAPLWADVLTTGGGDIYLNEKADSVTVRWRGTAYHTGGEINFEVELYSDGRMRFGYGKGNSDLAPTIGISAGDGKRYLVSALSGRDGLSSAPSATFFPTRLPEGLQVDPRSGEISGLPAVVTAGEVSFRVEDAAGQTGRSRCFLTIRPDGLALDRPRGGDLWLNGAEEVITWHWFGSAGQNVRLDYNTDGSTTAFPLPIAARLPLNARAFTWRLPPNEALSARIRLQSVEKPEFFTYSGLFSLVGPSFRLLAPAGGESWVAGSEAVVRWENIGETGPRLSLRYNTDGSPASFPLLLAGDVPNTGSHRVVVPATPSETCRLRIQSLEKPVVSAVTAGTFAIRSPSIRLTFPNGGDCLRAGEPALITWSVSGDAGAQVVLEYSTDGSDRDFPHRVSEEPLPNSGSALWNVPPVPQESVRLRIRSPGSALLADTSDGAFRISTRCALRTVLWVPFIDVEEEQVVSLVQALTRHEPDAQAVFSTALTSAALTLELKDKDVLLIPKQKQGPGVDFAALGRALAAALADFLEAGGSVVVCEQFYNSEELLPATGLLQTAKLGEGMRLCELEAPLHPLMAGVRPNFPGPRNTGWYEVRGPGVERLAAAGPEQAVVAAREVGFGRLAFLGFDYFSWNEATARILANAARQPLPPSGLRLIEPEGGTAFEVGAEVRVRWIARGEARGRILLAYNTTGSDRDFPLAITEVEQTGERGSFAWVAPAPRDGPYQTVRLKVESRVAPEHSDVTRGVIYLHHPLAIETASLPPATLGVPYRAEVQARGGVPPYVLSASGLPDGLILLQSGPKMEIVGTPQNPCEACAVDLRVGDSIGLSARKSLVLSATRREITLRRPIGRELWLFGGSYPVEWTAIGEVGETVSLSFNTDGSTVDFPLAITESAPIGAPFHWQLPAIDAPRCRLKVQSNEFPGFFSISRGEFSIVGPTIRLSAPGGGECWEPGKRKVILWQSAGNDAGTVRIEYSTDGSTTDFPHLIAAEAPNTGEYAWTVPETLSDDCRLRVSFGNAAGVESVSGTPFRISPACRLRGLFWTPCRNTAAAEDRVRRTLVELEPDFESATTSTTSPAELEEALANQDVLLVLLMSSCNTLDLENVGRQAGPALNRFVGEGGVVIFCAPQSAGGIRLLTGMQVVGALGPTGQVAIDCRVVSALHPITRQVPLRFPGPLGTFSYRLAGEGFETLVAAAGEPVAAARDEGSGRWVILGLDFQAPEPAAGRLLANAARMRAVAPGLRVLSPAAGAVFSGGEAIAVEWAARGERQGTIRIAFNDDGSTTRFPREAGEAQGGASGGTFSWTAPPPPAGERFVSSRVQVAWSEPPELPAQSEEVFFITRERLSVEVLPLAGGHQGAAYRSEVRAAGGVPPYRFSAEGLPAGLYLVGPEGGGAAAEVQGEPLETGTDQPVAFTVEDFLGSRASRSLTIDILPSRIELSSPGAGEFLLSGSDHPVRWKIHGYAGETLRIDYNLDGNTRVFPHTAAESVAAGTSFSWRVPDAEAPGCRLRVSSRELPGGIATVSEPFNIARPGITCLSPNGAEGLETGTLRSIRWRSLGNPGGEVRIEMNLDGSPGSFPIGIATAPDTGRYEWVVPRTPSESCRLRVSWPGEAGLEDASDEVFAIRYHAPVRSLVWIPHASFEQPEVRGAIAAATLHENDLDYALSRVLTPEELRSALWGRDNFLMAQQEPAEGVNFRALGKALGPVLREFAERGGTVVVLKQLGRAREFLPSTGLLEAVEVGRGADVDCRVALPEHPVTNQVPLLFSASTATAWYEIPPGEAEVYATDLLGRPVVAGKDLGDGRLVLVGFDYRDYTPQSARILSNSLRPTRPAERPRFVRGDANADGLVDIADAIYMLEYLYLGGRAPPCLDAADVDDSAKPGLDRHPVQLTDAVRLLGWLFLGAEHLPAPAPGLDRNLLTSCGPDPQFRDELGCSSYPPCE